jgi:antitoxin (DNA-binding transcriptional repressor) of toxin-antitoxin stability system
VKNSDTNSWKLQDAKARFSELVRKARTGTPQTVTVHGKDAVIVFDPERFEVRPKPKRARTMADFIEGSKKYRGLFEGVKLGRRLGMNMRDKRHEIFDGDYSDEDKT